MAGAGGVLNREELLDRIGSSERPLIREYLSLDDQVQPNGVDLTLRRVQQLAGSGRIGMSNAERRLPNVVDVEPDVEGWFHLTPGPWHITYNEIVDLPEDVMALGRPRSSLARSGVAIHTAVWDAGYTGRSTSLLHVANPEGFSVQLNARVMQLVFLKLTDVTSEGYRGQYHSENM